MALIKLGAFITQLSGKIGGQSISNRGNVTTIRNITQPSPAASLLQSMQRSLTSTISNSWQFLTQTQRDAWAATAVNYTYENRVGQIITRNAYQTFCFCNQNLFLAGKPFIQNAPTYIPVTVPKYNIIDVSSGVFTVQSNNSTSAYLYAVFAQVNISQGATAQSSSMRFVGLLTSAQLLAGINLIPMLTSYYGALAFPNKIGVTIDPINQTTGNRKQFVEIIENVTLPFIIEVTVPAGGTITIPFVSGGVFAGNVNFGDGTIRTFNAWNDANLTKTYTLGGNYKIIFDGTFPRFSIANGAFKVFFKNVHQFGSNVFTKLNFQGSLIPIALTPSDTPTLSGGLAITDLFNAMNNLVSCTNINNWDVSMISSLAGFLRYTKFSDSLNNWQVHNVTTLFLAMESATANPECKDWQTTSLLSLDTVWNNNPTFNRDIRGWNVGLVQTMNRMMQGTPAFDYDLSVWTPNVCTNTFRAFFNSKGNFSAGSWTVRYWTNAQGMFTSLSQTPAQWDACLIGWAAQPFIPTGIIIDSNATRTAASNAAFTLLTTTYSWTIT